MKTSKNSTKEYLHVVQYYETDQMKIVHHSNYIRWFEEARIDYLNQVGLTYHKLEEMGIISPVLEVNCQYVSMTRFGDTVKIIPKIEKFTGVKFEVSYQIFDSKENTCRAIGRSKHCFIDIHGKPMHLKRVYPDVYDIFISLIDK